MTRENCPDEGEVRISASDLVNLPRRRGEQPRSAVMRFLKSRGAPIKGYFNIGYDPEYSFTEWKDHVTNEFIIRWKKI